MFLKILQNSQGGISAGVSNLIKLQAFNFQKYLFHRTLMGDCFLKWSYANKIWSKHFIRWCADMNLFKVSSEISMENIDWFTTVETFSGIQADYGKLFFFCHRLSGKTLNGSVSKCILTGIDPIVSFTDIQFMWWMVTMILFSKMVTRIYW